MKKKISMRGHAQQNVRDRKKWITSKEFSDRKITVLLYVVCGDSYFALSLVELVEGIFPREHRSEI